MAAIRNAIDTLLQAATPRIVSAILPPNIIVTDNNLGAGRGSNLLANAGFYLGLDKWTYTAGFALNLASWFVPALQSTAWFGGAYSAGTGAAYLYLTGLQRIACVQNQIVEMSAYVGAHRCTCQIYPEFYNASGVSLGTGILSKYDNQNTSASFGGTTLDGYKRCYIFSMAPAGAVSVSFTFHKDVTYAGQTSSYGFIALPYLGIAGASQSELSPWSDGIGGLTSQINGTNYKDYMAAQSVSAMAYAVSAASATVTKSVTLNFDSDNQNVLVHLAVYLSTRINETAGGISSVYVDLKTNGTLRFSHTLGSVPNSGTSNSIAFRLTTTMYIANPGAGSVIFLADFVPFFGGNGTAGYIASAEIEIIGLKR